MARGEPLLGSLGEGSFRDAWDGPAWRGVRLAMKGGSKLPPCARCDDFLDENRRIQSIVDGA
jgi:hypothetical protein